MSAHAVITQPQPACRYKKLWDQDKDAYIRRYEKANKPLSSYELDIKEYLNKEVCTPSVKGTGGQQLASVASGFNSPSMAGTATITCLLWGACCHPGCQWGFVLLCHLQDEIQREETTANVKFLFVDCGPLKQMLTAHCQLWRNKLTTLLNNLAATELRSLHDHFRCA